MDNTRLDPNRPVPRSATEAAHDLRRIGEYRLLRLLGEGGMGAVYLAYHEGLDRQVAIKVLNDEMLQNQAHIDRFYREAKSGALLNHPNIVRTLNIGEDRATGKHYLVLEYVDGPSVRQLLDRDKRLPVGDAVHVAMDIARALEHVHSRNVVHRDIKPDNILITRSGVAKLADLGLAKRTDETSHLTATRQGFGTTYYMPYEQAINARKADGRSDIYALGATLYHLLTGEVPFGGESHLEVVEKKSRGYFTPPSILNERVPSALDDIVAKMMAREPRNRYQTASELIVDLERSGLSAKIPTFADPESARNDPWVQSRLASTEPTRLDLDTPPQIVKLPPPSDHWIIRYRNNAGKLCKARARTAEIARRLREGRLPANAELCREGETVFLRPGRLTEFQGMPTTRVPRGIARRRLKRAAPAAGVATLWEHPTLLVGAAVGLLLIVVGLILLVFGK
jgi:serine/threonine-protein kinase